MFRIFGVGNKKDSAYMLRRTSQIGFSKLYMNYLPEEGSFSKG
ncbi:MAG: hypothetical protein ACMUEL_09730 [Flavobacteriales bacterium Tduv]